MTVLPPSLRVGAPSQWLAAALTGALALSACAPSSGSAPSTAPTPSTPSTSMQAPGAPTPDPRVGLRAGLFDAEEAIWNLKLLSTTPPPPEFLGVTNSDLAFSGTYAFQGNYNGYQVWDIANPSKPTMVSAYVCPASQSDVSVYKNLLFISGEGLTGRIDCGAQGVPTAVSQERLRGVRIFDITDIKNPKNVGNVQTCRGSHTHTVLVDPKDPDNVYVYVSGSAGVRPADELPGCSAAAPEQDPNSALFRIEVIKVPLANPGQAAIVSSPRIFTGLTAPPRHGLSPADIEEIEAARARGAFVYERGGQPAIAQPRMVTPLLDSVMKARGGTVQNAADSAAVRAALPGIIERQMAARRPPARSGPAPGPTQCHDITVYPAIGLAGGACEGYGLLLDIRDPASPVRIGAVADSNFSYWHSATFNNDGSKVLFTDEWGGGGQPKCRATDPMEWGANALFTIENNEMKFKSYYKLPAPQTSLENCVAHNGSLIPIPGRDIMIQSWYQGGISLFDWTDIENPVEIGFHDRGPSDANRMGAGGSWSVYWYNGVIVNSEIARGLDVFELVPSAHISQNEIDAAKSVKLDYLNPQGQPQFVWPATFALPRAYLDQLERNKGLDMGQITTARTALSAAERASGSARAGALNALAGQLEGAAGSAPDAAKVRMVVSSLKKLAEGQ